MKHIVIESRDTEFPNPILLKKGMVVELALNQARRGKIGFGVLQRIIKVGLQSK